jgi:hypothetical protein
MPLNKNNPSVTGNFSVSIYDATRGGGKPGSSAGSVVASYDASLLNTTVSAMSWHNLSIVLTPNTDYFLVVTGNNLQGTPALIGWGVTANTVGTGFPSNRVFYNGSNWGALSQTYPFQMQIDASGPSAVPESSTFALLCIGLGVVGFVRKKMVKSEE